MFSTSSIMKMDTGLHAIEGRMKQIEQMMRAVEVRQASMTSPASAVESPAGMPLSQRLELPKSPLFSSYLQQPAASINAPDATHHGSNTLSTGVLPLLPGSTGEQVMVDGLMLDRPSPLSGAPGSSLSGSLKLLSGQQALQPLIVSLSQKHGVDSRLINAMIAQESNFNPTAVSRSGAVGLMQLMPNTAKQLGIVDPKDPAQNLDGGIRYIKSLLSQFNGNVPLALAAYNAGPTAVKKAGGIPPHAETQHYVRKILSNYLGAPQ